MTEFKEIEKRKEKTSFWQIWITLARPIFRLFATHAWVATGQDLLYRLYRLKLGASRSKGASNKLWYV